MHFVLDAFFPFVKGLLRSQLLACFGGFKQSEILFFEQKYPKNIFMCVRHRCRLMQSAVFMHSNRYFRFGFCFVSKRVKLKAKNIAKQCT